MGSRELQVGGNGAVLRASGALAFLLTALAVGLFALGGADGKRSDAAADVAFGDLPLSFTPNEGQTGARGRFVAQGPGYSLSLGPSGAELGLTRSKGAPRTLAMSFVGARPDPAIAGAEKLPGVVNSYVGDDPDGWRAGIPTFGAVRYEEPWPGISVEFHGNQSELEYDFLLAAGADPSRIRLDYEGAQALRIRDDGALVAAMPGGGRVTQAAPVSYQRAGEVREPVRSEFRLLGGDRVGVALGRYDRDRPLVVDPTLSYSTYLGGSANDSGRGIAVDGDGNTYVTGDANSTNFPVTAGAFQTSVATPSDVFVSKLNAAGTALIYSTYLGGNSTDIGEGIAVDGSGNAYVTGLTNSTDFPTTAGAFQTADPDGGVGDAFVTKLNAAGSALVYSTYLGGSATDRAAGVAVGPAGGAYVIGTTSAADFPTVNAAQPTLGGSADAFVTNLNATGSALAYSTYLGGSANEGGEGIALDSAGSAFVTGGTTSVNFPTTVGAFQTALAGAIDGFVTKLNAAGSAFSYSSYLGGSAADQGAGIAVDGAGNAYVAGSTASANFPTASPLQPSIAGSSDAFLTKVNGAGVGARVLHVSRRNRLRRGDRRGGRRRRSGARRRLDAVLELPDRGPDPAFVRWRAGRVRDGGEREWGGPRPFHLPRRVRLRRRGCNCARRAWKRAFHRLYRLDELPDRGPVPAGVRGRPGRFRRENRSPSRRLLRPARRRPPSACSPDSVAVGETSTCTATVTDTGGGAPSSPGGTVAFATDSQGEFAPAASCSLAPAGAGASSCTVDYVPGAAGTHSITATYGGNATHGASNRDGGLNVTGDGDPPPPDVDPPVSPLREGRAEARLTR